MWTIRDAKPADHAGIKTMSLGIQRAEQDVIGYPMLSPDEVSDNYFRAILATGSGPDGEVLLAEMDGDPVGYLIGYGKMDSDDFVDADFRRHAHIADLYLEPKARKLGIAREMLRLFSEKMKARGYGWVRVFAKAQNQLAVDAYTSAGFEPYEVIFAKRL